jgi:hypothetical protein
VQIVRDYDPSLHTLRRLGLRELSHMLRQPMRIDCFFPPHAAGAQHAIDERSKTVRFCNDDFRIPLQFGVRKLSFEQLCRAAHATERILDLVCELPNDLPRHFLSGLQLAFPDDLALARMIMKLQQDAVTRVERRRTAVETQIAPGGTRLERAQTDCHAIAQDPFAQLDQFVGTDHDFRQRMSENLSLAESEQILRSQIEIGYDE